MNTTMAKFSGFSNDSNVSNDTIEEEDVYDPFLLTDPLEDRIFGAIMVLYTVGFVGPYLACLWVFATDPEMSSKPCYRIIFHIGVSDVIQGVTNGIGGGLMSMLRSNPFEPNKRIGSILEGSWMAYSILVNLLAFNRFVQVCFSNRVNRIFTKRSTTIFIAICWAYGIGAFVLYNTPWVSVIYYPELYLWGYDVNPESLICSYVEEALDLFQLLCMIIWYIGIFVSLKIQSSQMSSNRDQMSKKEWHVLMQSLLICCLIFATCFGFFVVPQITGNNRYVTFVCDLIWLTNCGCNPIIYMAFNKTLRRKVLGLVGARLPGDATTRLVGGGRSAITAVSMMEVRGKNSSFVKNEPSGAAGKRTTTTHAAVRMVRVAPAH